VKTELLEAMAPSFGISGICNVLGAIKTAKRFRLGRGDILFTIATDGLDRYPSVLAAMTQEHGKMGEAEAERRIDAIFHHQQDDWYLEGTQHARDCWANLKYYTWVEQQGKTVDELRRQRSREYWLEHQALVAETDKLIREQRK
jgi:cysteine synthase A